MESLRPTSEKGGFSVQEDAADIFIRARDDLVNAVSVLDEDISIYVEEYVFAKANLDVNGFHLNPTWKEEVCDLLIKEKRKKTDRTRLFSNEERLGEKIPPRVDVYHDVSLGRIIVEVRAADQVGLLHLISKTISSCGFSIRFARIATEQGIATDIFNIERATEDEDSSPSQFLELREQLNDALNAGKYYLEV